MTAVIFGANGQDGYYLSELLISKGIRVIPIFRSEGAFNTDITSFDSVVVLIASEKPDYIFHFAADSTTKHESLWDNFSTITMGTINILEGVRLHSPNTKVFISGSGLQFKNNNIPIKETDSFEARDAYSMCRIQSVYSARYYRSIGIKCYVGYFFNHDSPRRSDRHITKKVSSFVKSISDGKKGVLEIGDLSTVKEWTFAGDIVEGIWILVNQDNIFEANVSSGKGYSIKEWVEVCFSVIGNKSDGYIKEIHGFKAEYKQLVSDSSLIQQLGFYPKTSLMELAKMMVNDK